MSNDVEGPFSNSGDCLSFVENTGVRILSDFQVDSRSREGTPKNA